VHRVLGAGVVMALVLLVAGCGGGDDEGTDGADVSAAADVEGDGFAVLAGEGVQVDLDALADQIQARLTAAGQEGAAAEVDGDRIEVDPGSGALSQEDLHQLAAEVGELSFRPVTATAPADACSPEDPVPPDGAATLPEVDEAGEVVACHEVGPTVGGLSNASLEDAQATLDPGGSWVVNPVFTEDGIDTFNEIAARCFDPSRVCPAGQLAIVVDGIVLSAPTVQQAEFERDLIQISGGFTESRARALAAALAFDPLPGGLEVDEG
jgi:preprotein translocase subunit SecD